MQNYMCIQDCLGWGHQERRRDPSRKGQGLEHESWTAPTVRRLQRGLQLGHTGLGWVFKALAAWPLPFLLLQGVH